MMDALRGFARRLRTWLRPEVADRELREELQFHTAMESERLQREGLAPAVARRRAAVTFGGVDRYEEEAREARGAAWLDELRQDARLALRLVRRSPHFTLAVVLTLALGIGANTAIFSVVDAVLLRSWPFADVERLMMVWETDRASGTSHEPASWPDVVDIEERSRTLESVGVMMAADGTLLDDGRAERISLLAVTPNLPSVLGVEPLRGRLFRAGEGPATGAGYGLLSEDFWRRRFGGRDDVIGSTLTVNGRPLQVIGVLPRNADLGIAQIHARADYSSPLSGPVEAWVALEPTEDAFPRQTHPLLAIGRLRAGASPGEAQRELDGIMADLEAAYPENAARGVNVEPYEEVTLGSVRRSLFVLLGGVGLVLLVACVNVANLLLARTAGRTREVAVRRALGASTPRIHRQLLVESVVLTVIGTALGLALAWAAVAAFSALAPPDIPRVADVTLDVRVLAIATTASAAVCILFGAAPILLARRVELQAALKAQGGRGRTDAREGRRFRNGLVVAEIALAIVLVVAAGLLTRSFQALTSVDPGFRTAGIIEAQYRLTPPERYPMDFSRWPVIPEINNFHAELLERVRALPGVENAALAARSPIDPGFTNSFLIVGREDESADYPEIRTRFITPGYLATADVPLIAGRDIDRSDVAGAEPVALINQAAASHYFPNDDPIDRQVRFWGVNWRVIGVMGDERFNGLDAGAEPAVYTPLAQAPQNSVVILARTAGRPDALLPGLRAALRAGDADLALGNERTLESALDETVARPRFLAFLISLFAGLAIVLALIGVHGVLSYSVARRAPEVGIRMALGATRQSVMRLIVGEGLRLAIAGTVIGLAGAAAAAQAMRALLFGVQPLDTWSFALLPAAVIALAALASFLPARRAVRSHPMSALRAD